jgi:hypothetical protein
MVTHLYSWDANITNNVGKLPGNLFIAPDVQDYVLPRSYQPRVKVSSQDRDLGPAGLTEVKPESFSWYHPDDPICVQSGLISLVF